MIPLSLVCLWKNEKKIVTYHRVIVKAQKACKSVEMDQVKDENDFELVHCKGKSRNDKTIEDHEFDVKAPNSYRLVRTVEMYQTKETVTETRRDNDRVDRTYHYKDDWFEHPISSANFSDPSKRNNNPSNTWPFFSKKYEAECVQLGEYIMTAAQCAKLGSKYVDQNWNDTEATDYQKSTAEVMKTNGFQPFTVHDSKFLMSSVH